MLVDNGAFTATNTTGIGITNLGGTSSLTLATGTFNLITTGSTLALGNFDFSSNSTDTMTLDGKTLSLVTAGNNLELVVAGIVTTGTYTLSEAVGSGLLHVGATTTATTTLANTGSSTADSLNYSGLGASSGISISGASGSGSGLADGTSTSVTQTFTASTTGSNTVTPTGSVTGANGSPTPVLANSTPASVFVYSGTGSWTGSGGGTWGTTESTAPANWAANGGIPGISGAPFLTTDSAYFGTSIGSGTATVSLGSASPYLNSITFNTAGSYTISQGGTGTLHLDSSSTATITDTAGNNTISAPVEFDAPVTESVGSSSTLTLSGNITQTGTQSFAIAGPGTTIISGSNTYGGGTTVAAGASLLVQNAAGSATGSGTFNLSAGASLGGIGAIRASTFALGAAGTPASVTVGTGTDTTSGLTITGSSVASANTITNAQLNFNLSVTSPGSANLLSVGSSGIAFSSTTLELNMVGIGIVTAYTPYELIAGSSNSQYSGFTTFTNNLGQTQIVAGGGLAFNFEGGPSNAWYEANSYLIETNGDIDIVVVPEPSTWAMMIGGLAALLFYQKRRNKSGRHD